MNQTQLLCTFCNADDLDSTIDSIVSAYEIAFNTIYVLENVDVPNTFCCTYNINLGTSAKTQVPIGTISLHRKKATNTLYTINALNSLIAELNNGVVDKNFRIEWSEYSNTILVTAYDKLKTIKTKLHKIVKV